MSALMCTLAIFYLLGIQLFFGVKKLIYNFKNHKKQSICPPPPPKKITIDLHEYISYFFTENIFPPFIKLILHLQESKIFLLTLRVSVSFKTLWFNLLVYNIYDIYMYFCYYPIIKGFKFSISYITICFGNMALPDFKTDT
jgi:hypothetical protein